MNELVRRLSKGEHRVEASLRPNKTVAALKESIERNYVHIKFIDTKGGTELGVKIDNEASNWKTVDFDNEAGEVCLVGDLTLNYEKVRCVANINLKTLEGKGHLIILLEESAVEAEVENV